jgi:hypothetical protein
MSNLQIVNKCMGLDEEVKEHSNGRDNRDSIMHLQHLHEHVDNITNRVPRPEVINLQHRCPNFGEKTQNNIVKLKLGKHVKSVIVTVETMFAGSKFPEDLEMFMSFPSDDNNSKDDIMPFARTCNSGKGVLLSVVVRSGNGRCML